MFGTLLLLLYLPRITRPIEALLDEAAQFEKHDPMIDEQQYLIDTFRKTIATLRTQEEELRRLHDQQKSRADDFERVTAALTRSLTSGFIAADPTGQVADVNASGREILHIPMDQPVVGRSVDEVFGATALAEVLRGAIEKRESLTRREVEFRAADGARLNIGLSTVPLLNEQSMFLGMLALFTDLTPVRELERRVRDMQALADLGEMSAGIAHEFRNSMSTILGYLKLAQRQQSAEEMRMKLQKAEDEAALLSEAIVSLLNYTRPMNVERQTVDLHEVVTGILEKLPAETDGVVVHVDGRAGIVGDRTLLTRAFENVLRNALDSLRTKGGDRALIVKLRSDPPSVIVKDNGVGIAAGDAGRLFLPFQSDRPGGFGLGLPLAKKIVLLHGGTISLTGTPGEGAEVEMVFPPATSHPRSVPEEVTHEALR
jgi:signal transduction histidine kinase